jgi:hypothetical protein
MASLRRGVSMQERLRIAVGWAARITSLFRSRTVLLGTRTTFARIDDHLADSNAVVALIHFF